MNKIEAIRQDSLQEIRHSLAHLLAMAVLEKHPNVKLGMSQSISARGGSAFGGENGFYYDFQFSDHSPSDECFPKLEKTIRELIKKDIKFEKEEISKEKAEEIFKEQPYKLELINELEDSPIIYKSGDFTDLCAGPHVKSTLQQSSRQAKGINPDAFKLTKIAGAYWKGNEKNPMLTRIYGIAFETKKELEDYLKLLEEAEKRDHRKLGKQLDLFCFSDLVGAGLPLFTPKGVVIIDELKKQIEKICSNYGFKKVLTPHLAKISLYEKSGHAKKFSEELFHVSSSRKHEFVIRPVLCPHQTQIYASKPRSYRDLPIRYMETEKMYRAEKTGEIGGLNRVYAITVEDGHSFCRVDQVKDEVKNIINIIKDFYSAIGLWGNHRVSLSVRDYNHPEKYIGEPKDWDKCESMLKEISDEMKLEAKKCEGEAALYGPKLDFMFKDALGKEIQIPTVQLDFATPKRFGLVYTDKKGQEQHPVMIHRAILGSYERFLVLLLEYFAGAFPVWLSPVQAIIIPVSEKFNDYAKEVYLKLLENEIRVEVSDESETLGKRIRNAELQKIPYILVVGEKEKKSSEVAVRSRQGDEGAQKLEKFIERIQNEILKKK